MYVRLYACLLKYLSACMSACLPLSLHVCLPICLCCCLSVCLCVCLSICLPVCLSVYLSTSLSVSQHLLHPTQTLRNSRELGFGVRYPTRDTQRQLFRWAFILSYLLQGALFSAVLVSVSPDKTKWVVNVGFDIAIMAIFAIYFNTVHNQNVRTKNCHFRCLQSSSSFFSF